MKQAWVLHFSLLLSSLCNCLWGQEVMPLKKLDGLSQNTVFNLLQDKQHFLWISTGDGLNRYDGKKIEVYKPGNLPEGSRMEGRLLRGKLVEDSSGNIWFGTEMGLHCFNVYHNRIYKINPFRNNPSSPNTGVSPVAFISSQLWFYHPRYGLGYYLLPDKKINFIGWPLQTKPDAIIMNVYFDGTNKICVAGSDGLMIYNFQSKK